MATITHEQTGRAASLFNAAKQLGSVVGVALLTTVVALASPARPAAGHVITSLTAFRDGFLAAALTLAGVLLALRVSDTDAAHTMVRRPRRATAAQAEPASPAPAESPAPARSEPRPA
jgi:hypothetical protein